MKSIDVAVNQFLPYGYQKEISNILRKSTHNPSFKILLQYYRNFPKNINCTNNLIAVYDFNNPNTFYGLDFFFLLYFFQCCQRHKNSSYFQNFIARRKPSSKCLCTKIQSPLPTRTIAITSYLSHFKIILNVNTLYYFLIVKK